MSRRIAPPWTALLLIAVLLPATVLAATPAGFTPVAMQKHDAGTYYIDGAITGYGDLRLLVDTGSSYLVISQTILEALKNAGTAHYARDLEGVMADGSSRVIPVYRLSGLRLGEKCWIRDVEAAVFPGNTRPILGMNILTRLAPFTFSADPPELGLQQCQASSEVIEMEHVDPPADAQPVDAKPETAKPVAPATTGVAQ